MRELISTIVNIANQNPEVTRAIEAVMLHLRSREMSSQKRIHILISVVMSLVIRQVLGLLSLLLYPLTDTLKFFGLLVLLASGYMVLGIYDARTPVAVALLLTLSIAIFDLSASTGWARHILFDLLDIISFGTLTKLYAYFLIQGGQPACEFAVKSGDHWYAPPPLANHFFSSRQAYVQDAELTSLMDQMMGLSKEATPETEALSAVRSYWDSQP